MGGDEFVIVLAGVDLERAASLAERVRDAVNTSIVTTFGAPMTSFSIGFASFPEEGADVKNLLTEADRRMYLDKQERKKTAQDLTMLARGLEDSEYSLSTAPA